MDASRLDFAEALDQLSVSYCIRKQQQEIHVPSITDNTDKRVDAMWTFYRSLFRLKFK
jgi:hypothetical protein